mgnify:CR=1 FL=1
MNYAARYYELTDQRDAVNAKIAPLQAALDQANAAAQEAQAKANAIAQKISDERGGQKWLDLKREIGLLSRAFGGKIPPRDQVEAAAKSAA